MQKRYRQRCVPLAHIVPRHMFSVFESLSLLYPIHTCLPRRLNSPHLLHLEDRDPTLTRVGIKVSEGSQKAKVIVANCFHMVPLWRKRRLRVLHLGFQITIELLAFPVPFFWQKSTFLALCWRPSASTSPQVQVPGTAVAAPRARAVPLTSRFVFAQPAGSQKQATLPM